MPVITREFYDRSALEVARDLLGCRLVRRLDGVRMGGLIVETEAYQGEADLGCHASAGRTPRTTVMYGPPGHAYVYFTYGLHWLLNAVTAGEGTPAAVLIRALQAEEGTDLMAKNRPFRAMKPGWTDGPAKLTQALGITSDFNSMDLCDQASELWIESGKTIQDRDVLQTARVGLNSAPEPWKSIPWRFVVDSRPAAVDEGGTHGS